MRLKCKKALVVFIKSILPEGNFFGTKNSDEFYINVNGAKEGVFKRFEYPSLPFSITQNEDLFNRLLKKAQNNGTSFKDELENDLVANKIMNEVFNKMENSPSFSKQTLDTLLSNFYVKDNILTNIEIENDFENNLAKVILSWNKLADFYCIEGLVGGDGEINPLNKNTNSSLISGGLDSLETILPILKKKSSDLDWKKILLKMSSIIGRDYKQIDKAVNVLGTIYKSNLELKENEIEESKQLIDELTRSRFDNNTDIGKFYNALIRFHNWMPLSLKKDNLEGDVYDSICKPSKNALELLDNKEISSKLSNIRDATSPKGLALVTLVDEDIIGSKNKLIEKIIKLEKIIDKRLEHEEDIFYKFNFTDPVFYTALVGGKWRGLKLLYDTREALNLNYKIPDGFVISSIKINKILKENEIFNILNGNIFYLSNDKADKIIKKIENINFDNYFNDINLSNKLIIRSSMYGEDGISNFSGTYNSLSCTKDNVNEAIKEVIKSYFNREAIKSREDIGLAHIPGISLIVQEKIDGIGGVIHLMESEFGLSMGETPEDVVLGKGNHKFSNTIVDIIDGTPLNNIKDDLNILYNIFGNLDIEFVINNDLEIYLTQLRPKYKVYQASNEKYDLERKLINNIDDLKIISLNSKYVVRMDFLGRDNIMDKENIIMDFIRKNKNYIVAIEGNMPKVAHIPNKIEGHFRIPYLYKENDK